MQQSSQKPLYEQVYEDLKDKINDGTYAIGKLIPAEKTLTQSYNVSRITIQKAVNQLAAEGLVDRRPGVGTTVINQSKLPRSNKLIGLVMSGLSESYGDGLIRAITDACSANGYSVIVKFSNENQATETRSIQELLDIPVRGILISPIQQVYFNPLLMQEILDGFPIVVLDKEFSGIDTLFVGTDHHHGALTVAQFVADRHHTNVSVLAYDKITNASLKTREDAVIEVYSHTDTPMRADNIAHLVKTSYLQYSEEEAILDDIANIKAYLLAKRPTCVICIDSNLAVLTREAIHQLSLRIPEDISLIGFDSNSAPYPSLRYTYLAQNELAIGQRAVGILLRAICGDAIKHHTSLIAAKLVDYGSVIDVRDTNTDCFDQLIKHTV